MRKSTAEVNRVRAAIFGIESFNDYRLTVPEGCDLKRRFANRFGRLALSSGITPPQFGPVVVHGR